MCKFCWFVMILLLLGGGFLGYKFMSHGYYGGGHGGHGGGSGQKFSDSRTQLTVSQNERDFVLEEMRGFLESVQQITQGLVDKDMQAVAEYAKQSGLAVMHRAPKSLMARLPAGFRSVGHDTHKKFDEIANMAQHLGEQQEVLSKLNDLLQNCVTCHADYKMSVKTDRK